MEPFRPALPYFLHANGACKKFYGSGEDRVKRVGESKKIFKQLCNEVFYFKAMKFIPVLNIFLVTTNAYDIIKT